MEAKEVKEKALELYTDARFLLSLPGAPLGDNKDHVAKQMCLWKVEGILRLPSLHEGRMMVVMEEDYAFWKSVKSYLESL